MPWLLVALALLAVPALASDADPAQSAEDICLRSGHDQGTEKFKECVRELEASDLTTLQRGRRPSSESDPMLKGMDARRHDGGDDPDGEGEVSPRR